MTKKLTGLHPLAYMGVNSEKPPNLSTHDRDPLTTDYQGFAIGSLWVRPVVNRIYMLTDKTAGVATWLELSTSSGGDDVESLIADDGLHAQPNVAGDITIVGGSNITTSANIPNELRIDLSDDVIISGYLAATDDVRTDSNFELPASDNTGTEGVLTIDGNRFLHNYTAGVECTHVGEFAGRISAAPAVSGDSNTSLGFKALNALSSGHHNTTVGAEGLRHVTSGKYNTAIGYKAGEGLLGTESSNIFLGNTGTITDSNKIRIGTQGSGDNEQDSCAIAGIYGVTPAGAANQSVIINADGELGSETGSAGNAVPVGSIVRYDQTLPPGTSWLPCDGSAVSQTTYAALFGVIGHKYLYPTFTSVTMPLALQGFGLAHNGLAAPDGLWIAIDSTYAATSPDGITWTVQTTGLEGFATNKSIIHNGLSGAEGLWMLLPYKISPLSPYATSPDGVTWTVSPIPAHYKDILSHVAHNGVSGAGGLWVAYTLNGILTSSDAVTWTPRPSGIIGSQGLNYFDNKFFIFYNMYNRRQVFYSADPTTGASWLKAYDEQDMPSGSEYLFSSKLATGNSALISSGVWGGQNRSQAICLQDLDTFEVIPYVFKANNYNFRSVAPIVAGGYDSYLALGTNFLQDNKLMLGNNKGNEWLEVPYSPAGLYTVMVYSNKQPFPDEEWVTFDGYNRAAHGTPGINTATEFYLPNIEDQVILF